MADTLPRYTTERLRHEIERAVLAERERCASVAEHFAQQWGSPKGHESAACFAIADAIRKVEGGATAAVSPALSPAVNQPTRTGQRTGGGKNE